MDLNVKMFLKKINVDNFKTWFIKLYFSIIGFFIMKKLKENDVCQTNRYKNTTYLYRKNKQFYQTIVLIEPNSGFQYFKTNNILLPYWQVGILKLKKINNFEVINEE